MSLFTETNTMPIQNISGQEDKKKAVVNLLYYKKKTTKIVWENKFKSQVEKFKKTFKLNCYQK